VAVDVLGAAPADIGTYKCANKHHHKHDAIAASKNGSYRNDKQ